MSGWHAAKGWPAACKQWLTDRVCLRLLQGPRALERQALLLLRCTGSITSGLAGDAAANKVRKSGAISFLKKPINTDVLDFAKGDYKPTPIDNNKELLKAFEDNQKQALESLAKTNDEYLQNSWTMRNGEEIYLTTTKEDVIRMTLSQTIHHRAQMGVFLRMLNIPIPGSYGPSADEMGF